MRVEDFLRSTGTASQCLREDNHDTFPLITIRPIRATDLALEQEFVNGLSAATGRHRLMSARRPSLEELRRFTDIDYERELALIATTPVQGRERQIGVARYVKEESSPARPNSRSC